MALVYLFKDEWYGPVLQEKEYLDMISEGYFEMLHKDSRLVDVPEEIIKEYKEAIDMYCGVINKLNDIMKNGQLV